MNNLNEKFYRLQRQLNTFLDSGVEFDRAKYLVFKHSPIKDEIKVKFNQMLINNEAGIRAKFRCELY